MPAASLNSYLMVFCIISSFFFSLIIRFDKRRLYLSHPWLAAFLHVLGVFLLAYFWVDDQLGLTAPYLVYGIYLATGLMLPPIIYLYVSHLSGFALQGKRLWLHFVPAAAGFLFLSGAYLFLPDAVKAELTSGMLFAPYPEFFPVFFKSALFLFNDLAFLIQMLLYVSLSLILLKRKGRMMSKKQKSEWTKQSSRVRFLLIALGIYVSGIYLSEYLVSDIPDEAFDLFFLVGGLFLIGLLAFPVFYQATPRSIDLKGMTAPGQPPGERPVREDVLTRSEAEKMLQRLEEVMESKPFLDPDFSMSHLADLLGTNRNYLSVLFNDYLKNGYHTYINRQRIQVALEILSQEQSARYSLDGVARMVGFRSKSTFIHHFRLVTAQTPGQFRAARKTHQEGKKDA